MLRSSYFQSTVNPIQVDRLPPIRTQLEFPAKPATAESPETSPLVVFAPIAALVALVSQMFAPQLGATLGLLPWFMALLVFLAMLGESLWNHRSIDTMRRRIWLPCALLMLLSLVQFEVSLAIQVIVGVAMLGYFSFCLGEHWVFLCTASPLPRPEARALRRHYRKLLRFAACCPLIWVFLVSPTMGVRFVWFAIPVGLGLATIHSLVTTRSFQFLVLFQQAWRSWFAKENTPHRLPGLFQSPSGAQSARLQMALVVLVFAALPFADSLADQVSWTSLADTPIRANGLVNPEMILIPVKAGLLLFGPLLVVFFLPLIVTYLIVVDVARFRQDELRPENWTSLIRDIRESTDPIERVSLYLGRNAADGSPLLVPRAVFSEHAHFLGDSGSGKTALGLSPLIEQLVTGEPCSVVVLDLKGDSMELYGSLAAAAASRRAATGFNTSLKHFSTASDLSTFTFNPFRQSCLDELDLYQKTDILCSALGLDYGADYGEGYYSSANAAVLYETLKQNPEISSFRDAAQYVHFLLTRTSARALPKAIKDAGDHVYMVLDRLGSLDALNVTPTCGYPNAVVDEGIDLSQLFLSPQLLYFHLPSTLAPHTAPEIGRLVVSTLLVTAKQTERRYPVYLVIDEFQRMVAKNLEMVLQLARSMGVAVILANQSMQDLKTSRSNLIPAIEGNCRFRQWFSVSHAEERQQIERSSGQTVETLRSNSTSQNSNGQTTVSRSQQETILPRLAANDVLLCSDHCHQSIVRISRGEGYAQFGGMSCLIESTYHITADEYQARRKQGWPDDMEGAFVPRRDKPQPAKEPVPQGPIITTEVVGGKHN